MNIRRTLAATLAAVVATLWTLLASAGTLSVRDDAHLFAPADVQTLNDKAAKWPFDVHVLTQETGNLDDASAAWVDGPKVLVVGISPTQRKTVVRFGNGSGVKAGDFDSISKAGNENFRTKHWKEGVEVIVLRAQASAESKTSLGAANEPLVLKQGLGAGAWFSIVLGFAALGWFIVWIVRRQKRERDTYERTLDATREEAHELRTRNIKEAKWEEKLTEALGEERPTTRARSVPTAAPPATTATSPTRPETEPSFPDYGDYSDLLAGVKAPTTPPVVRTSTRPAPARASSPVARSTASTRRSGSTAAPPVVVNNASAGSSSDFAMGYALGNISRSSDDDYARRRREETEAEERRAADRRREEQRRRDEEDARRRREEEDAADRRRREESYSSLSRYSSYGSSSSSSSSSSSYDNGGSSSSWDSGGSSSSWDSGSSGGFDGGGGSSSW